jgi:hypothetical protein
MRSPFEDSKASLPSQERIESVLLMLQSLLTLLDSLEKDEKLLAFPID